MECLIVVAAVITVTNTDRREILLFCRVEDTGEYCAFEHFNASCRSPTERIYIRSAQYGRMRVGRCVKVDLGYLGCAADVRHVIESRCSGRPRCSVPVADDQLRTRSPCPTDVTWYLQVSYACVTGQSVASRQSSPLSLLLYTFAYLFRANYNRCRSLHMPLAEQEQDLVAVQIR